MIKTKLLARVQDKFNIILLSLTTLFILVSCTSDSMPSKPVEPEDFRVTTSFSSDEPKLIVEVEELETTGLEKLEYKLERFSSQCNDSDKVYTGAVSNPAKSMSFDIATEAYGAYKLSVSATYGTTWYQNTMKTILPAAPTAGDFPDLPTGQDLTGLVFIEVLNAQSAVSESRLLAQDHIVKVPNQIHLPDNNGSFEFGVPNFRVQLDKLKFEDRVDGKHNVIVSIKSISDKDRKWCSLDGEDLISKDLLPLLQDGTGALQFKNPIGEHEVAHLNDFTAPTLELVLEPNPVNGNRVPFTFFHLEVHKLEKDANGNSIKGADVLHRDYFIQDCATKKSEFSEFDFDRGNGDNRCFDDNDFPR